MAEWGEAFHSFSALARSLARALTHSLTHHARVVATVLDLHRGDVDEADDESTVGLNEVALVDVTSFRQRVAVQQPGELRQRRAGRLALK